MILMIAGAQFYFRLTNGSLEAIQAKKIFVAAKSLKIMLAENYATLPSP